MVERIERVEVVVALGDSPSAGAPADGPRLPLRDGGRWAVLTVSDSGAGIDPIDLPFVFDRFYLSDFHRESGYVRLGDLVALLLPLLVAGEDGAAATRDAVEAAWGYWDAEPSATTGGGRLRRRDVCGPPRARCSPPAARDGAV